MTSSTRITRLAALALCLLAAAGCRRDGHGDGDPAIPAPEDRSPDGAPDPFDPDPGDNGDPVETECVPEGDFPPPPPIEPDDDGGLDWGAPQFSMTISPESILIAQGETADLSVTIVRNEGFDEAVEITVDGLPSGVTASPLQLLPGETGGTITLTAEPSAATRSPDAARVRGRTSLATNSAPLAVDVRSYALDADTSFATGGVFADLSARVIENAVEQSDGRILYSASRDGIGVCRVESTGVLDASFGAGGCFGLDVSEGAKTALALQRDGRILLAWGHASGVGIARLTRDGELDASFGESGLAGLEGMPGGKLRIFTLGGRIVVARGEIATRLSIEDGSVDPSFGTYGRVALPSNAELVRRGDCGALAVTPDLLRAIDWRGDVDLDFGASGTIATPFPVASVAVTRTGDFLLAGMDGALAQVSASGTVLSSAPGSIFESVRDVDENRDGEIVLSGTRRFGGTDSYAAMAIRRIDGTTLAETCECWSKLPTEIRGTVVSRDGRYFVFGAADGRGVVERVWD